jgi:RNA polymerase primary sigma factor
LLSLYLRELNQAQLLTAAQERELADKIRKGNERALQTLVTANLRFVVDQVKRFRSTGVSLHELIAEGNLGLIRAAQQFDPGRGTRFTTYAAWWIREAVSQFLARSAGPICLPEKKMRAVRRIRAVQSRLIREKCSGSEEDLAREAKVSVLELRRLALASRSCASLEAMGSWGDGLGHGGIPGAERRMFRCAKQAGVARLVGKLDPRERLCVRLHLGLPGGEGKSFREIGELLKLGREGTRQLFLRAIRRLRKMADAASLQEDW